MGKTGEQVSILGFGCMRLPTVGMYRVDRDKATPLLEYALDKGVNYLDTAYPYHGVSNSEGGDSEVFLGEYLQENSRRDDVYLSTKLPVWLVEERQDMDKFLDEQLKRLKTDYIDFYLLHSVKKNNWPFLEDLGVLEFLDSAVADGRIRYIGFSTHDDTELFKTVLDSYLWDICMIQYNYLDEEIQAGREGLESAAKRGTGVAVMEPLKGGALANHTPPEVRDIWDKAPVHRTAPEWALRFLWNHPQISTVLSGMNTMRQVVENIFTAEDGLPHSLTREENIIMEEVKKTYNEKILVECSSCGYCMPCPSGVNIPQCLSYLNQAHVLNDDSNVKTQYHFMLKDTEKASKCTECGLCEELCTQKLPIPDKMKMVREEFGR